MAPAAPTTGTLTITKVISGIDGVAKSLFSYILNGGSATAFDSTGTINKTVNLGAYTVVESGVAGGQVTADSKTYNVSYTGCSGTLTTTPALCTITNTYVPPAPVLCANPLATNFNQPGPCVLPPCPVGQTGIFPACVPVPPTLCADPLANNIGLAIPCTYTDRCPLVDGIQTDTTLCPNVPPPTTCTVVVMSDTNDFVVEKSANAQVLSFIHTAWTATFGTASWIWGDNPVVLSTGDETQTFRKQFGFVGTVTGATLEVASDNSHVATLNAGAANAGGSTFNAPVSYNVTSAVAQGNNQLLIAVTNQGPVTDPKTNPAGLKYRLTIQGTPTTDADCSVPYAVDVCPNIDGNQAVVPEGKVIVNNQCVPIVNGCTNPVATNYNQSATPANPQATNCDINYASQCGDNPNLLTNASFENPVIAGPWSASTITDWVITKVSDNSSTLGEIWRGLSPSSNGSQHVELDSAEPTKLTQAVTTIPGATYQLRFDLAARSDASSAANNRIKATADAITLVDHSTSNTNWTTYGGTFTADASTDIALADIGTPADSLGTLVDNAVLCLVSLPGGGGDNDPDTYKIQGYVWHDDNVNEIWDGLNDETEGNEEAPLAGWTVHITDGETTLSTTTDAAGFYYFNVPAGTWTITEDVQTNWFQTNQESYVVTVPAVLVVPQEAFLDSIINAIIPTAYAAVIGAPYGDYNFGNDDRTGGGGHGGGHRKTPAGDVLGAATSSPEVLGDQVSAVPAGAPNAGAGSTSPFSLGFFQVAPVAFLRRARIHG